MKCEFCGKNKNKASTTFFGQYCKECIKIVIEQCEEALEEIRNKK